MIEKLVICLFGLTAIAFYTVWLGYVMDLGKREEEVGLEELVKAWRNWRGKIRGLISWKSGG